MYTLSDLEKARADLSEWQRRFDNYSGNNPNKFRTDIRNARDRVAMITDSLKKQGLLQ